MSVAALERVAVPPAVERSASLWSDAWRRLRRNRAAVTAGVFLAVVRLLGFQVQPLPWSNLAGSSAVLSGLLLWGGVLSALGGYLAAWLDSRAPLVTATAFGTLLLVAGFAAPHIFAGPVVSRLPAWYLDSVPVVECLGTIAGGVLCVRTPRRAHVA